MNEKRRKTKMSKTNRQKRVAKRKRESKKRKTTARHIGKGIFIGYAVCLTIFVSLMLAPNVGLKMYNTTGGGEFDFQLMGAGIKNPYDKSERVVVFSNDNGHAYIDGTRTTWISDGTEEHWDYFDNMNEGEISKPDYIKAIKDDTNINSGTCWYYAPPEDYSDFNNENSWLSATGCNLDVDGKYTGVPDLGISIINIYPSDDQGNVNDDYGHKDATRTLIDKDGNQRTVEMHYGFVTLQVLFTITADTFIEVENDKIIRSYLSERVGSMEDHSLFLDRDWNVLGSQIDFNTVFRLQINALKFTDDWVLNPEWWNFGNGILEVYRRGFGDIAYSNEAETEAEPSESGESILLGNYGWEAGANNIILTQGETVPKFGGEDGLENAMDLELQLTPDDGTVLDFKTQNPNTVFLSISNYASLGLRYDIWGGSARYPTLEEQNLYWVQDIVVKFYTSVCMPLAGEGQNPFVIYITPPVPPAPTVGLWSRLVNWVSELLGVKPAVAELIIIVCIIIVSIIVVLILLAIFAPQVFPMIAKAIAGFFKRRAMRRAARK